MREKTKLKIGEFSQMIQVTVKTLRHYEQKEKIEERSANYNPLRGKPDFYNWRNEPKNTYIPPIITFIFGGMNTISYLYRQI